MANTKLQNMGRSGARLSPGEIGYLVLTLCLLLCTQVAVRAQNQSLSDSLETVYIEGLFESQDELKILKELAEQQTDTEKKLSYSIQLIDQARAVDSVEYEFTGYFQKGNAYRLKGDMSRALENYFRAATLASEQEMYRDLGLVDVVIADVYSITGSHDRSITYYHQAIDVLRKVKDSINLASALLNTGDEFFNYGSLDSALIYFREAESIFKALEYELGIAYVTGNIGLVLAKRGQDQRAERQISNAVSILERIGDYYPISVYFTYMSDIYRDRGADSLAMSFAMKSLQLAKTYGLKKQISDANLKLSELYEADREYSDALKYYKDFVAYRDSVNNVTAVQNMADLRADFEVAQKQAEVDLLNTEKRNQRRIVIVIAIALVLIIILAMALYRRNRLIGKAHRKIEEEKHRSDQLLLNILPEETARELKRSGRVQAKKFESVSVMFADFKDFSSFAEGASPEELVQAVDFYFSRFDEIMEKHGLEKIKTIGDAYMAAGGIPFPSPDHAHRMVMAAMDMMAFVKDNGSDSSNGKTGLDIRIGINTGPIIAGVVGIKKFAYDIWGDTVNIASRMESTSSPGRINISENTYRIIEDRFKCTSRGQIQMKNRGMMNMYFVEGRK